MAIRIFTVQSSAFKRDQTIKEIKQNVAYMEASKNFLGRPINIKHILMN